MTLNNPTVRFFVLTFALAFFPAITRAAAPSVTITAPHNNNAVVVSNAVQLAGTVHGAQAVTVEVNGTAYVAPAPLGRWTLLAPLNVGAGADATNVIQAYAQNLTGYSITNTIHVLVPPCGPILVQPTGPGKVSPNYNGQYLEFGVSYHMTAIAGKGGKFQEWTGNVGGTPVQTAAALLDFTMQAGTQLQATFADTQAPTLTVNPVPSSAANSIFTLSGKAADNSKVAGVSVLCNGQPVPVFTTNGYAVWSATTALSQGNNTITVYAYDAAGNDSHTNTYTVKNTSSSLAPDSLEGVTVTFNFTNGFVVTASFGMGTFAIVSQNSGVIGAGDYFYVPTGSATALLTPQTLAPSPDSQPDMIGLSFIDATDGTFTNRDGDGTFTLQFVAAAAPPALLGEAVVTTGQTGTVSNYFAGQTLYQGGEIAGAYYYTVVAPAVAMLTETVAGATNDVFLSFTAADAGNFVIVDSTGNILDSGTFVTANVANVPTGFAPSTLADRSVSVSQSAQQSLTHHGTLSFTVSYGGATFAEASSNPTNGNNGAGIYSFGVVSASTGVLDLTYVFPPSQEQGNTEAIDLDFTSKTAARATSSDGIFSVAVGPAAAPTAPASLVGRKLTVNFGSSGGGTGRFGLGTFITGSSAGNYIVSRFSPKVLLVQMTYTDADDTGAVEYLVLTFTSQGGGAIFDEKYNNGTFQHDKVGTFTIE